LNYDLNGYGKYIDGSGKVREGLFEANKFVGVAKENENLTRMMLDNLKQRGDKLVEKIKWNDYLILPNDAEDDDDESKTSSSQDSS
jgi:hypothetical protein